MRDMGEKSILLPDYLLFLKHPFQTCQAPTCHAPKFKKHEIFHQARPLNRVFRCRSHCCPTLARRGGKGPTTKGTSNDPLPFLSRPALAVTTLALSSLEEKAGIWVCLPSSSSRPLPGSSKNCHCITLELLWMQTQM